MCLTTEMAKLRDEQITTNHNSNSDQEDFEEANNQISFEEVETNSQQNQAESEAVSDSNTKEGETDYSSSEEANYNLLPRGAYYFYPTTGYIYNNPSAGQFNYHPRTEQVTYYTRSGQINYYITPGQTNYYPRPGPINYYPRAGQTNYYPRPGPINYYTRPGQTNYYPSEGRLNNYPRVGQVELFNSLRSFQSGLNFTNQQTTNSPYAGLMTTGYLVYDAHYKLIGYMPVHPVPMSGSGVQQTAIASANNCDKVAQSPDAESVSTTPSEQQKQVEQLSKTNIYIRGLPRDYTDAELNNLCSHMGAIRSLKAIMDKDTNKCKGYGFVDFHSSEVAAAAILKINKNTNFHAQMAKQQEQDPTNLYFANLAHDVTENMLENVLLKYGTVISARILRDNNGKSKGVGFARMETKEICDLVIATLNNQIIKDFGEREILIKFADGSKKPKHYHHNVTSRYTNGFEIVTSQPVTIPNRCLNPANWSNNGTNIHLLPTNGFIDQLTTPYYRALQSAYSSALANQTNQLYHQLNSITPVYMTNHEMENLNQNNNNYDKIFYNPYLQSHHHHHQQSHLTSALSQLHLSSNGTAAAIMNGVPTTVYATNLPTQSPLGIGQQFAGGYMTPLQSLPAQPLVLHYMDAASVQPPSYCFQQVNNINTATNHHQQTNQQIEQECEEKAGSSEDDNTEDWTISDNNEVIQTTVCYGRQCQPLEGTEDYGAVIIRSKKKDNSRNED